MTEVLDPVTLTVIGAALEHICAEMDLVHEKTSFSPVISEAYDRSNGIYHAKSGEVIAQGPLGLPIFMGVMQATTKAVIDARPDVVPGDIFIINDPYLGGTHLMDVKMVRPFYYGGVLWCWLSNTGHWPDTGGKVPGGFSTTCTEIQQEGLRLPPVRIAKDDVIQQEVVDIILSNIRVPEERIGDIKAQIGALFVGEQRLTALLDRFGEPVVSKAVDLLSEGSERQMRLHIEAIPDGEYIGRTIVDSDGLVDIPLEIVLAVTIRGAEIVFDLSRSSLPCRGPLNSTWAATHSAVLVAMKHVFPDVPINAGCFRPLRVRRPLGTFLDARYPRPVAGCAAEVSQRIAEAVFVALGQAIPNLLFGAPAGTSGNLGIGGFDPEQNRFYVMYFFSGGGYGGWVAGDGITNGPPTIGISKTQPVEVLEHLYPIVFEKYAIREGSGGAGRFRGGCGIDYRVRLLRGEATASFLMDHGRSGPPGLAGGSAGAMNVINVSQSGRVSVPVHLSKGDDYRLEVGDWIEVSTPGGGGFGPANERASARTDNDQRQGYCTQAITAPPKEPHHPNSMDSRGLK